MEPLGQLPLPPDEPSPHQEAQPPLNVVQPPAESTQPAYLVKLKSIWALYGKVIFGVVLAIAASAIGWHAAHRTPMKELTLPVSMPARKANVTIPKAKAVQHPAQKTVTKPVAKSTVHKKTQKSSKSATSSHKKKSSKKDKSKQKP